MKNMFRRLGEYRVVKKIVLLYACFLIITELLLLSIPKVTQLLISSIEKKSDAEILNYWIIILGMITIFYLIFKVLQGAYKTKLWLVTYLEKMTFYKKQLFTKDYSYISDMGTGKVMTIFSRGVEADVRIMTAYLQMLISSFFKGGVIIIIFFIHFPLFITVIILFAVLLHIINALIRKKIDTIVKQESDLWAEDGRIKARLIMENLVIRIFGKSEGELKKSESVLQDVCTLRIEIDRINRYIYIILEGLLRVLELGLLLFVGYEIIKGGYSMAFLFMLITYIWLLWQPLDIFISAMNILNEEREHYKKLQNFIKKPNTIVNGKEKYSYKNGNIEFRNIDFGYSEKIKIFKDLNLEFLAGKKNALVGHSGGGKSTLTKLILRLYDIDKGKILLDGQDIKNLDINTFYSKIGYLPQEPAIFDGTIRENMEYAFDSLTASHSLEEIEGGLSKDERDSLIWEALKKARIDGMIEKLEGGLATEVGEKGIKLSGGEKQRLAIARIFLKDPEIIILDEPTSALDSISESKVGKALDELVEGRTSIIIAHRLQTVMHSDKIIVIENGKIEAEGEHSDLIKKSSIYKSLVDLQNGTIAE